MNEIYKNITNPFLPNIIIDSILLKDNNIVVTYKLESIDQITISNFTANDYFKYLEILVSCGESSFVVNNTSVIPSTNTVNLSYSRDINLSLDFGISFDLERLKNDLNVNSTAFMAIGRISILNINNQLSYPITDTSGEVINTVVDDGIEVPTKVIDYRKITNLNNIQLKEPFLESEINEVYFTSLGSSTYGKRLSTFIEFDFLNYLKYNSFFSNDNYDNFSMLLTITDNSQTIDKINISRTNGNNINFVSINEKSFRIRSNSNKVLFYFYEEFISNTEINKSYNIKIDYVDTTFLNFYYIQQNTGFFLETINKFNILKNNINIAKKFSDYQDSINKINPFYLVLDTDKFTNQFNNFYNSQILKYNSSFNIDITTNSIIDDIIQVINKFAVTAVTTEQVDQLKNDLAITDNTNCTYSSYISFFEIVDGIFDKIQNEYLSKSTATKRQYIKSLPITKIEISDQYYVYNDITFINSIPIFSLNTFNDIIISSSFSNITPKYFYNFGNLLTIDNNLDYETEAYNSVFNFITKTKNKTRSKENAEISFGEEILSQYSLTYSVSSPVLSFVPKQSSIKPSQFSTELPQQKFSFNKTLTVNQIKNLDSDILSGIRQDNKFIHSLAIGKTLEKPIPESMAPVLQFFYYEQEDQQWKSVVSTTKLVSGTLIKVIHLVTNESLLSASKISKEKIHLDSNYFVLGKI